MPEHLAGAVDRLDVAAAVPLTETVTIRTALFVQRWDAEAVAWTARRARQFRDLPPGWEPTGRDFADLRVRPYGETFDEDCNLVTEAGFAALIGGVAGTSITTKFDAGHARIGVGTSATAATGADTKLGGDTGGSSTTSYYKLVSGAPAVSTAAPVGTLIFTAAFGAAQANFAWQEFGTDNGTADGVTITGAVFLNHGISSQGSKTAGQVWTATETMSFGFPSGAGALT